MASYVLLAYVTVQPAPSSEDLSVASRIVKWITKQQNPHGGFSSTQDTVVALQALSKYGTATFANSEKAALVTVKGYFREVFSKDFQVDDANCLLLQKIQLPKVPGEYTTTVSGSGCVYLQTSLRYNILPKKKDNPSLCRLILSPRIVMERMLVESSRFTSTLVILGTDPAPTWSLLM
ncbi:pregnancy zone protein-like [Aotus nancymaae]|uniref:pregnancy zone protein-like n=1 Tax=Aotus nancymaae TaxID=37293 RepID=UPI0030FF3587